MPSLFDQTTNPAKILLIGKSGAGKTGSLAQLVVDGYKLRIIDTDKGINILRSLLTDLRYPYAAQVKSRNIDLRAAVQYVPIDLAMTMRSVPHSVDGRIKQETILAPKFATAWSKAVDLLDKWRDGNTNLGNVGEWDDSCILVLDSFSTLAKCAYYFSQSLNGRLGARDEGYDYQRDIGAAQSQLTRMLELLYSSSIQCNVIVISHITWVDESRGVAASPKREGDQTVVQSPDGYPSAIGRALSPQMGKYFNDIFVVKSSGSGQSVRRTISTVPTEGVLAKNSVYLDREYPIQDGLGRIFAALRGGPSPYEQSVSKTGANVSNAPALPQVGTPIPAEA